MSVNSMYIYQLKICKASLLFPFTLNIYQLLCIRGLTFDINLMKIPKN